MSCKEPSPSTEPAVDNAKVNPTLDEDERQFYLKAFPNVEQVRERRIHCTVCRVHLGTAPINQANIKMHPILRVTLCAKCFDFYNTGEFSKGEDGSELYCRWCGQGGEVYCCSKCPFVFCKSCIVKNLERGVISDIEKNENWNCFRCSPKILWPLRAQHWSLVRYMVQQKNEINALNLPEEELKQRMNLDNCNCCRLAKSRASNISSSMESLASSSSRTSDSKKIAKKIKAKITQKNSVENANTTTKRTKDNDEVVCTPDLQSMLEPDCQLTTGTAPMAQTTPPPLVLRNSSIQIRTVPGNFPTSSSPVYHVVNGFRIDLNSAAQKGIYTLPNGKMIQVKRTGVSGVPTATNISNNGVLWSRPCDMRPVPTLQQQQQQQSQPSSPQLFNSQPFLPNANSNALTTNSSGNQINQIPNLLKRHAFPNTPLGQARSGLQDKIISAQIIYQHFNNKLQTFCNSNAYKQARAYHDVRDLYITLSYMCTYTMGRMQGLQNEILEDMRQLGFGAAANNIQNGQYATGFKNKKEECSKDEIEIIEPKTDTITIDSDDENTSSSPSKKIKLLNTAAASPSKNIKILNSAAPNQPIKINKTIEIKKLPALTGINMGNRPMNIVKVVKAPPSTILNTTNTPTPKPAVPAAPSQVMTQVPSFNIIEEPVPMDTNNDVNLSEDDMLLATQSILASMLEVEIEEEPGDALQPLVQKPQPKKQPRKKTYKVNPDKMTILKQARLEYMKRTDYKLKNSTCRVMLTRVDENPEYAKYFEKLKKDKLEEEKRKKLKEQEQKEQEENDDVMIIDDGAEDETEITIINDPIPEIEGNAYQANRNLDFEKIMPVNYIANPPDNDDMKENTNICENSNTVNDNQKRLTTVEINESNKTDKNACKKVTQSQTDKSIKPGKLNDISDTVSKKIIEQVSKKVENISHKKNSQLQTAECQNIEEEPKIVNEPLIENIEDDVELKNGSPFQSSECQNIDEEPKIVNEPLVENIEDDFKPKNNSPFQTPECQNIEKESKIVNEPIIENIEDDVELKTDSQLQTPECEDIDKEPRIVNEPLIEDMEVDFKPKNDLKLQTAECQDLDKETKIVNEPLIEDIEDETIIMTHKNDSQLQTPECEDIEKEPKIVNEPLIENIEDGLDVAMDNDLNSLLDLPLTQNDIDEKSKKSNELINEHTYSTPLL